MSTLQRLLDYNSLHWISWLIAYRVSVTFRLPIWAALLVYMILLGSGAWIYRHWFYSHSHEAQEISPRWFATILLLVGVLLGSLTLFFSRPDSDDISYMGDMRLDTKDLSEYFSVRVFWHSGLEENSLELYRAYPYETFIATASNLIGIEPMQGYHNLAMIFLCVWWAIVYGMLFRAMGLSYRYALIAIALAALFLLMDGNLHRSHGNFAFMRLWQGKVVMIAILLPQTLMSSLRFFQVPTQLNWIRLCAVVVIGTEFNQSGIFLIPPILVAGAAAARLTGMTGWKTSISVILAGWFPLMLGLWIVLTSILPVLRSSPVDVTDATEQDSIQAEPPMNAEWRSLLREILVEGREQQVNLIQFGESYPLNWYENIYDTGIGSNIILLRDLVLLFLPIALIPRREGKFLAFYNLIVIFLVATPLTGPILINLISNAGYWRVLFLLPLPLCFGLLAGMTQWSTFNRQGIIRWSLAVISVVLCLGGFQQSVLSSSNGVEPKNPWDLRLWSSDVAVAQKTAPLLTGESVIAIEPLSSTLSLTMREDLKALAYGNVRSVALPWSFVDTLLQCHPDQRVSAEMIQYILNEFGATYIFMRDCGTLDATDAIIDDYLSGWQRVSQYGNYWLLTVQDD